MSELDRLGHQNDADSVIRILMEGDNQHIPYIHGSDPLHFALLRAVRCQAERIDQSDNSALSEHLVRLCCQIIAVKRVPFPIQEHLQLVTAEALRRMGPRAKSALSDLQKVLYSLSDLQRDLQGKELELGRTVAEAIGCIGPSGEESLKQVVRSAEFSVRSIAAQVLAQGGSSGFDFLLQTLLDDGSDPHSRRVSALALQNLEESARAVGVLRRLLHREEFEASFGAVLILREMGPAALPAFNDLRKALGYTANVRHLAVIALGNLGPVAVQAIGDIQQLLRDNKSFVRSAATVALGNLGPAAVQAIGDIQQLLRDNEFSVRSDATVALGKMGPNAVNALRQALHNVHWDVRREAIKALGKQGVLSLDDLRQAFRTDYTESVNDQHRHTLHLAAHPNAEEIGRMGLLDEAHWREALQETNSDLRIAALFALGELGAIHLNDLQQAIEDTEARVRFAAIQVMEKMGSEVLDILLQALHDSQSILPALTEPNVQKAALDAISKLGIEGSAALGTLRHFLKKRRLRVATIQTLGHLGPTAASVDRYRMDRA